MADWYVSSVNYTAVAQWAATTAYTVGQFIRPVTPSGTGGQALHVYRCTTAGTSASTEPGSWATGNNGTTASGGATFTNVTGQSTYGWSAAAGSLYAIGSDISTSRPQAGDRVFVASDHSENIAAGGNTYGYGSNTFGVIQFISVNRAGSVPPVAADVLNGASVTNANGIFFNPSCNLYFQGISFYNTNTSFNNTRLSNSSNANKNIYFKNCLLNSGQQSITTNAIQKAIFDNTPIAFNNSGAGIALGNGPVLDLLWINTPNAVQGTVPTTLFSGGGSSGSGPLVVCRGIDLSAVTGNLIAGTGNWTCKVLLDSCRINSAVTRLQSGGSPIQEIELVNCFDGTNVINERHIAAGDVTTDRSTYLTAGAQDDVGNYSFKLASNANSDFTAYSLDCFAFDVENTNIGTSKTATVEVVSSASLNNVDIRLLLEYMGSSGSPVASMADSLASLLTASAALPTSSNTWTIPSGWAVNWNPLDMSGGITLSNNNLTASQTSSSNGVRANLALSGKVYFELTIVTQGGGTDVWGVCSSSAALSPATTAQYAVVNWGGSGIYTNGASQGTLSPSLNIGVVIGVAVDVPGKLIWFRNGSGNWNGSSGTPNPATGVGGFSFSSLTGSPYPFFAPGFGSDSTTANFGATAFANAAPSGFSAPALTPVKQLLQTTFTPQRVGRIRGIVRLGKVNTTVWVNPQIAIS